MKGAATFLGTGRKYAREQHGLVGKVSNDHEGIFERIVLSDEMKRIGYIFEEIYGIENCRKAILEASENKRKRRNVKHILENVDEYAEKLSAMIKEESWECSPYTVRYINDGVRQKRRKIAKPRFWPDQCIHHAFDRVVGKLLAKKQYYYCTGCVKGKGIRLSKRGLELFIKRHPAWAKWVDKMDVHHCYDSVDHEALRTMLRKKIKDEAVLRAYFKIIDSYPRLARDPEAAEQQNPEVGIPIGIDPSRWLLNMFLSEIDHAIKRFLGKRYFMTRYADDIVIVGPAKRMLRKAHALIETMLHSIKLKLKSNWQIFKLKDRPIDFLGFKFHKDCVTLRKTILLRILRKIRRIQKMGRFIMPRMAAGMLSYKGYLKYSDSQHLRDKYIKGKISFEQLGKVVSDHERIIQRAACSNVA